MMQQLARRSSSTIVQRVRSSVLSSSSYSYASSSSSSSSPAHRCISTYRPLRDASSPPSSSVSSSSLPSSFVSSLSATSVLPMTGEDMAHADLLATPDVVAPVGIDGVSPILGVAALPMPMADPFLNLTKNTFEIKDSELIFRQVWNNLKDKFGEENMSFPSQIMWLAGAPGAGKGAMTAIIQEYRGIRSTPIEVGALLTSPAALALKAQGKLVGDQQVMELLLESLLQPEYNTGVVVDGFPRTLQQAECIKLLFDQITMLRTKYADDPEHWHKHRRPIFNVTVLFVDREESVKRQLRRGSLAIHHNEMVVNTGVGVMKPVRETDLSPTLAAERYKQFKEQVYESLKLVKTQFHFHFINAEGSPSEVRERIIAELSYQSNLELSEDTFACVRKIPLATEVITNARHDLIRRLDNYRARESSLFDRVIDVITNEFIHIIRRQALSGRAIIRSENTIFRESGAIDMALDLMSERGYTITLDYNRLLVPTKVNIQTGEIINTITRVYEFEIDFPKPTIRRGM